MRRVVLVLTLSAAWTYPAQAHDIPNARVDRSIQATARPGLLRIDYEVALSELTLTQDLRALIGTLPGADRLDWFAEYGRVVGPLNARGLLVSVDGRPLDLRTIGHDLAVEEHPRFTFHFEANLPDRGRLTIQDANYEASEGTSRLAIRGSEGVVIRGDTLPGDVALIPVRPIWELTDAEERRTRRLEVDFRPEGASDVATTPRSVTPSPIRKQPTAEGLSRLLDRSEASALILCLIALSLGAVHAIQPGHGKTLVAAASVADRGGWSRGILLALTITTAHMGGVLAIAAALWASRTSRYPEINRSLTHGAGFVIAAIGSWRLGRSLGGYDEHADGPKSAVAHVLDARGLIGLGLAGGIVPCWDAVVLIVLAEAVGRLALGLALLSAFSLGMAAVLVAVGVTAVRLRGFLHRIDRNGTLVRRLGLLSAAAVTTIGVYLLVS